MGGMFNQLFLCTFYVDFYEIDGAPPFGIEDFGDGKSSDAATILRILHLETQAVSGLWVRNSNFSGLLPQRRLGQLHIGQTACVLQCKLKVFLLRLEGDDLWIAQSFREEHRSKSDVGSSIDHCPNRPQLFQLSVALVTEHLFECDPVRPLG